MAASSRPSRCVSVTFETGYISESDDDDDDFHVTMQEFSDDEDMSPVVKREESTPAFTLAAPSPMDDFDSSDGGYSIARTPTPGLSSAGHDAAPCRLVDHAWDMFGGFVDESPFHSYSGLTAGGLHAWDSQHMIKHERADQGWSRAPSPDFAERAHRLMGPSPLDLSALSSGAVSPAAYVIDNSETNTQEGSSSSTRSSLSSASSGLTLSIPTTPSYEVGDPLSRRSSAASSPLHHHPLILYSPCLSPTADMDRPLKCGLAHRYIFPHEDAAAEEEKLAESLEVQELERRLLDFGDDSEVDILGGPLDHHETTTTVPSASPSVLYLPTLLY